jgi:hypothetical protein
MAKAAEVDLDEVRERRYVLKDILNTNLLSPEARKVFEKEYAETGSLLEQAAKASS